jgi:hypothetical protein
MNKRSSVCPGAGLSLEGVRFEVVEPVVNGVTGEMLNGWDVRERGWWGHLSDGVMWRLVARGVLTFASGERFRLLGLGGDRVDVRGLDGFVMVGGDGGAVLVPAGYLSGWVVVQDGGAFVGVGGGVRGCDFDLQVVRCLDG